MKGILRALSYIAFIALCGYGVATIISQLTADSPEEIAECRADQACWGKKHKVDAQAYCQTAIESQTKYSFRWTNEGFKGIFSRSKWVDQEAGVIQYFGDTIELQNGIGAWSNYIYACLYDTLNSRVINVAAESGRL